METGPNTLGSPETPPSPENSSSGSGSTAKDLGKTAVDAAKRDQTAKDLGKTATKGS